MVPAALNFKGFQVSKIVFDRPFDYMGGEFDVNIQHETRENETDNTDFICVLVITITPVDKSISFNLQIESWGSFKIQGDVTEKVSTGFKNISAPAIVYPFVRAFISNITVQTGVRAIVLPSVNFATGLSKPTQDNKVEVNP